MTLLMYIETRSEKSALGTWQFVILQQRQRVKSSVTSKISLEGFGVPYSPPAPVSIIYGTNNGAHLEGPRELHLYRN